VTASGLDAFRILSLSGGGARGVFQARFLELLEKDCGPLRKRFDLIAATSTGALAGLAIAAGIPASQIVRLYRDHAEALFPAGHWRWLRRGGRYDPTVLRNLLEKEFGTARLGDLDIPVLIVSSVTDTYQGHVLSRDDLALTLVDAAMASAAAPTYYPPTVPAGQDRGYLDGGLWANDPTLVALNHALYGAGVAAANLRLLAVGTGRVQHGDTAATFRALRPVSPSTFRVFLDLTFSLQAWFVEQSTSSILRDEQMVRVNPYLARWIPLDDARNAVAQLPALAESEYQRSKPHIERLFQMNSGQTIASLPDLPLQLRRMLAEAGVTRFMPSRRHYALAREGRESISTYISLATKSLTMVSINLATGKDIEEIITTFDALLVREQSVHIIVSLLDYRRDDLMQAIAPVINRTPEGLRDKIQETVDDLTRWAHALPDRCKSHFELRLHSAVPNASAIMIDEDSPSGLIQLETKAYRAAWDRSYAMEVRAGSEFYTTLKDAYRTLVRDGTALVPPSDAGQGSHS
jgi:predicted acylesterase/phospholipase RssA